MLERVASAKFRKDLKLIYGNEMDVVLMPDVRGQDKRDFDFFTLYKGSHRPLFMAWEMKKIDGMTFNTNQISHNQMVYFNKGFSKNQHKELCPWSIFIIKVNKLNVYFIIDQLIWDHIFLPNPSIESMKIVDYKDHMVTYTLKDGRVGTCPACSKEKIVLCDGTTKKVFNGTVFINRFYKND